MWCGPLCLWMRDWLMTKLFTMSAAHLLMLFLDKIIDFFLLMLCAKWTLYVDWEPVILHLIQRESINNSDSFHYNLLNHMHSRQESLKMLPKLLMAWMRSFYNLSCESFLLINNPWWNLLILFTFPGLKVNKSTYFSINAFTFSSLVYS